MRSERYETHYRVGSLNGRDLYWHPQEGYAVEKDRGTLVDVRDLSDAMWFDREEDLRKALKDIGTSNGELLVAMGRALFTRVGDALAALGYAGAEKQQEVERW